jgi:hypothetical protein
MESAPLLRMQRQALIRPSRPSRNGVFCHRFTEFVSRRRFEVIIPKTAEKCQTG